MKLSLLLLLLCVISSESFRRRRYRRDARKNSRFGQGCHCMIKTVIFFEDGKMRVSMERCEKSPIQWPRTTTKSILDLLTSKDEETDAKKCPFCKDGEKSTEAVGGRSSFPETTESSSGWRYVTSASKKTSFEDRDLISELVQSTSSQPEKELTSGKSIIEIFTSTILEGTSTSDFDSDYSTSSDSIDESEKKKDKLCPGCPKKRPEKQTKPQSQTSFGSGEASTGTTILTGVSRLTGPSRETSKSTVILGEGLSSTKAPTAKSEVVSSSVKPGTVALTEATEPFIGETKSTSISAEELATTPSTSSIGPLTVTDEESEGDTSECSGTSTTATAPGVFPLETSPASKELPSSKAPTVSTSVKPGTETITRPERQTGPSREASKYTLILREGLSSTKAPTAKSEVVSSSVKPGTVALTNATEPLIGETKSTSISAEELATTPSTSSIGPSTVTDEESEGDTSECSGTSTTATAPGVFPLETSPASKELPSSKAPTVSTSVKPGTETITRPERQTGPSREASKSTLILGEGLSSTKAPTAKSEVVSSSVKPGTVALTNATEPFIGETKSTSISAEELATTPSTSSIGPLTVTDEESEGDTSECSGTSTTATAPGVFPLETSPASKELPSSKAPIVSTSVKPGTETITRPERQTGPSREASKSTLILGEGLSSTKAPTAKSEVVSSSVKPGTVALTNATEPLIGETKSTISAEELASTPSTSSIGPSTVTDEESEGDTSECSGTSTTATAPGVFPLETSPASKELPSSKAPIVSTSVKPGTETITRPERQTGPSREASKYTLILREGLSSTKAPTAKSEVVSSSVKPGTVALTNATEPLIGETKSTSISAEELATTPSTSSIGPSTVTDEESEGDTSECSGTSTTATAPGVFPLETSPASKELPSSKAPIVSTSVKPGTETITRPERQTGPSREASKSTLILGEGLSSTKAPTAKSEVVSSSVKPGTVALTNATEPLIGETKSTSISAEELATTPSTSSIGPSTVTDEESEGDTSECSGTSTTATAPGVFPLETSPASKELPSSKAPIVSTSVKPGTETITRPERQTGPSREASKSTLILGEGLSSTKAPTAKSEVVSSSVKPGTVALTNATEPLIGETKSTISAEELATTPSTSSIGPSTVTDEESEGDTSECSGTSTTATAPGVFPLETSPASKELPSSKAPTVSTSVKPGTETITRPERQTGPSREASKSTLILGEGLSSTKAPTAKSEVVSSSVKPGTVALTNATEPLIGETKSTISAEELASTPSTSSIGPSTVTDEESEGDTSECSGTSTTATAPGVFPLETSPASKELPSSKAPIVSTSVKPGTETITRPERQTGPSREASKSTLILGEGLSSTKAPTAKSEVVSSSVKPGTVALTEATEPLIGETKSTSISAEELATTPSTSSIGPSTVTDEESEGDTSECSGTSTTATAPGVFPLETSPASKELPSSKAPIVSTSVKPGTETITRPERQTGPSREASKSTLILGEGLSSTKAPTAKSEVVSSSVKPGTVALTEATEPLIGETKSTSISAEELATTPSTSSIGPSTVTDEESEGDTSECSGTSTTATAPGVFPLETSPASKELPSSKAPIVSTSVKPGTETITRPERQTGPSREASKYTLILREGLSSTKAPTAKSEVVSSSVKPGTVALTNATEPLIGETKSTSISAEELATTPSTSSIGPSTVTDEESEGDTSECSGTSTTATAPGVFPLETSPASKELPSSKAPTVSTSVKPGTETITRPERQTGPSREASKYTLILREGLSSTKAPTAKSEVVSSSVKPGTVALTNATEPLIGETKSTSISAEELATTPSTSSIGPSTVTDEESEGDTSECSGTSTTATAPGVFPLETSPASKELPSSKAPIVSTSVKPGTETITRPERQTGPSREASKYTLILREGLSSTKAPTAKSEVVSSSVKPGTVALTNATEPLIGETKSTSISAEELATTPSTSSIGPSTVTDEESEGDTSECSGTSTTATAPGVFPLETSPASKELPSSKAPIVSTSVKPGTETITRPERQTGPSREASKYTLILREGLSSTKAPTAKSEVVSSSVKPGTVALTNATEPFIGETKSTSISAEELATTPSTSSIGPSTVTDEESEGDTSECSGTSTTATAPGVFPLETSPASKELPSSKAPTVSTSVKPGTETITRPERQTGPSREASKSTLILGEGLSSTKAPTAKSEVVSSSVKPGTVALTNATEPLIGETKSTISAEELASTPSTSSIGPSTVTDEESEGDTSECSGTSTTATAPGVFPLETSPASKELPSSKAPTVSTSVKPGTETITRPERQTGPSREASKSTLILGEGLSSTKAPTAKSEVVSSSVKPGTVALTEATEPFIGETKSTSISAEELATTPSTSSIGPLTVTDEESEGDTSECSGTSTTATAPGVFPLETSPASKELPSSKAPTVSTSVKPGTETITRPERQTGPSREASKSTLILGEGLSSTKAPTAKSEVVSSSVKPGIVALTEATEPLIGETKSTSISAEELATTPSTSSIGPSTVTDEESEGDTSECSGTSTTATAPGVFPLETSPASKELPSSKAPKVFTSVKPGTETITRAERLTGPSREASKSTLILGEGLSSTKAPTAKSEVVSSSVKPGTVALTNATEPLIGETKSTSISAEELATTPSTSFIGTLTVTDVEASKYTKSSKDEHQGYTSPGSTRTSPSSSLAPGLSASVDKDLFTSMTSTDSEENIDKEKDRKCPGCPKKKKPNLKSTTSETGARNQSGTFPYRGTTRIQYYKVYICNATKGESTTKKNSFHVTSIEPKVPSTLTKTTTVTPIRKVATDETNEHHGDENHQGHNKKPIDLLDIAEAVDFEM